MRSEYICSQADAGRKLYGILRKELALSQTQLRRIKPAGGIFVNGEPAHTDYIIKPGDRVSIELGLIERDGLLQAERGPVDVLWEQDGLIAVNKPAGILVHPTSAQVYDTLANYVYAYILDSDGSGACHVVNRLDRDTTGCVLFAKSARMKNLASQALVNEKSHRVYIAAVLGTPAEKAGEIDIPLKQISQDSMRRGYSPDGQRSVTKYKVLYSGGDYSVCIFKLITGRTHQIRAHCFEIGHPVLGDKMYNSRRSVELSESLEFTSQALHAAYLGFEIPRCNLFADIYAPVVNPEFEKLLKNINLSLDKSILSDI